MVHGGVRYLEQAVRGMDFLEYKVVKRALRERIHMLQNAPFLTRPRQFITPCYSWREVAYYETGLKLYDWIAGAAGLAPSRFLSRDETLRRIPGLNVQRLVGSVAYTDGQFDDARYNLTLLLTFVEAGGEALNYARVTGLQKQSNGRIAAAEIDDRLSGRRFAIRARAFINATGPSADTIRFMAAPGVEPRMRLSRGVHILLAGDVVAGDTGAGPKSSSKFHDDALLVPKTEDGRVLFAIPWMDRVLIGTTDQEVERVEQPGVNASEVEYLLRHVNRYLVQSVTPDQIVSGFAGVRPLVTPKNPKPSGKADTKALARDHEIEVDHASGLISIMGGKWTTYRAMAEDTIDSVEHYLGRKATACRTAQYRLAGSDGFTPDSWLSLVREYRLSEISAKHLSAKFGTHAADIIALAKDNPPCRAPLAEGLASLGAEVVFCARYEMATSLDDILARRIGLEFQGWRDAIAAAPVVADLLGAELGWSAELKQRQLGEYIITIEARMRDCGLAPPGAANSKQIDRDSLRRQE